jgi:uncharacterized protein (TIGR00255 family)
VVIELRAVNHRFFDCRVRFGPELARCAPTADEVVRSSVVRGSVEVVGRLEGHISDAVALDVPRARAAYRQLAALRDELCPGERVPLELLAAVPDLFAPATSAGDDPALEAAVRLACERACIELDRMRRREGDALRADLSTRVGEVERLLAEIRAQIPASRAAQAQRLTERVEKLLGLGQHPARSIDSARLEQEIAILADRSDISEEIARLESHLAQTAALIATDDGPVGRKIEFVLQEMNRETNTIGAKCGDTLISQRIIDIKGELERLREQTQNVL